MEAQALEEKLNVLYRSIDPRKIKLLDVNAHYMRNEKYQRLVENIRRDGALTSVPLCWIFHDDSTQETVSGDDGEPIYEVLSGNHRVTASIEAGLDEIDIKYVSHYIAPDRRRAIQLSHNSLVGDDDPAVLKLIYDDIQNVEMRIYAGLDDKMLELMDKVSIVSLSEANLTFQTVTMTFLPDELEEVKATWEAAQKTLSGSKHVWLARYSDYDALIDSLDTVSNSYNVLNIATCMMVMLTIFRDNLADLSGGYLDELGEPVDPKQKVPIESVLGDNLIPADDAARLNRIIEQMISRGELDASKRSSALGAILDYAERKESEQNGAVRQAAEG